MKLIAISTLAILLVFIRVSGTWAEGDGSLRDSRSIAGFIGAVPRLRAGMETGIEFGVDRSRSFAPRFLIDAGIRAFGLDLDLGLTSPFGAIQTAGASFEWRFFDFAGSSLAARTIARWRSYQASGDEIRYGAILRLREGASPRRLGIRPTASAGYSILITRVSALGSSLIDLDPLAGLGMTWRVAPELSFLLGATSYCDQDPSLFLKTFFEIGAALEFESFDLDLRGTVKYSDFFTLTARPLGMALRIGARFDLNAAVHGFRK